MACCSASLAPLAGAGEAAVVADGRGLCEQQSQLVHDPLVADWIRQRYPEIVLRRTAGDRHARRLGHHGGTDDHHHYKPRKDRNVLETLVSSWLYSVKRFFGYDDHRYFKQAVADRATSAHWYRSPIHAFAAHPYMPLFAVARFDDGIDVHRKGMPGTRQAADAYTVLVNDHQRGITSLAWCPTTATTLAVGCRNGVILWRYESDASATFRLLKCPPVHALAWSPDGQFLACASPMSDALFVWDLGRNVVHNLVRPGGVAFMSWSPNGNRLLVATMSSIFRVWDPRTWTCEIWRPKSRLQCACWSDDSQWLLFAEQGSTVVYSLQFKTALEPDVSVVFDTIETPLSASEATIGGNVLDLAWDQSMERLAILCEGKSSGSHVAVLRVRTHRMQPELVAAGVVSGPEPDAVCQSIAFQRGVMQRSRTETVGAVLVCGWTQEHAGAQISFVPFFFNPEPAFHTSRLS